MPVMTRSQRLRLAQQQQIEGQESRSVSKSAEKPKTTRSRTSRRKSMITAEEAKEPSNEFRDFVQTMLDSPHDNNKMHRKPMVVAPSPRVERITLANKKNQQMEFLIPPKENDSALEIREQIRAALYSPDAKEQQQQKANASAMGKASSSSPMFHEKSPNAPSLKAKEAERISRLLMMVIFTILIAVFIACYKDEIVNFLQVQLTPLAQYVKECWEWTVLNLGELWKVIVDKMNTMFANKKETGLEDGIQDETITK